MQWKQRQGSIPLVVLVVLVLSLGAGASMFLSRGTARMEHRFGLKTQAKGLAQAAVEEILVRLTNGAADAGQGDARYTYTPGATVAVANAMSDTYTIEVGDVQVMKRLAEQPASNDAAKTFEEIMKIGSNFGVDAMHAKGVDLEAGDRWAEHMIANPPAWTAGLNMRGTPIMTAITEGMKVEGDGKAYFDEFLNPQTAGESYWHRSPGNPDANDYGAFNANDENDRNAAKVKVHFENLPFYYNTATPLTPHEGSAAPAAIANRQMGLAPIDNWHTIPLEDYAAIEAADAAQFTADGMTQPGTRADRLYDGNPDGNSFMAVWNKLMNSLDDQVNLRIANCDGNKNYGFGSMVGSFILGAAPEADQDEEEDIRNAGQDGGNLDFKSSLVTVTANVKISAAGTTTQEDYLAHRLVASTNASKAAEYARNSGLVELLYVYNITPHDFHYLQTTYPDEFSGMVAISQDGGGLPTDITALQGLWTKLYEGQHDLTGMRVVPFEAANCLVKTKGA